MLPAFQISYVACRLRDKARISNFIHYTNFLAVRTFPYHQLFMGEETEAKRSLLHILMIYCTHYNKVVGYCQGMTLDCAVLTDDPVPTYVCSAVDHYQILFAMLGMAYVAALLLMSNMLEEVWAFNCFN